MTGELGAMNSMAHTRMVTLARRSVVVDPTGQFAFVANSGSNEQRFQQYHGLRH